MWAWLHVWVVVVAGVVCTVRAEWEHPEIFPAYSYSIQLQHTAPFPANSYSIQIQHTATFAACSFSIQPQHTATTYS